MIFIKENYNEAVNYDFSSIIAGTIYWLLSFDMLLGKNLMKRHKFVDLKKIKEKRISWFNKSKRHIAYIINIIKAVGIQTEMF